MPWQVSLPYAESLESKIFIIGVRVQPIKAKRWISCENQSFFSSSVGPVSRNFSNFVITIISLRKTWAVSSQQIISKYSGMVTGRASEHGDCYECGVNPLVQFRQNHENKLWLWPCFWFAVKIVSNRVLKNMGHLGLF